MATFGRSPSGEEPPFPPPERVSSHGDSKGRLELLGQAQDASHYLAAAHIQDLLQWLELELVRHRPDDPVSFIHAVLGEKLEQRPEGATYSPADARLYAAELGAPLGRRRSSTVDVGRFPPSLSDFPQLADSGPLTKFLDEEGGDDRLRAYEDALRADPDDPGAARAFRATMRQLRRASEAGVEAMRRSLEGRLVDSCLKAISDAEELVRGTYALTWNFISRNEAEGLDRLCAVAGALQDGLSAPAQKARQRSKDICDLYADAAQMKPSFDAAVHGIEAACGGLGGVYLKEVALPDDLKSPARVMEKLVLCGHGGLACDARSVCDIVRVLFVAKTLKGVAGILKAVVQHEDIVPCRLKNRFTSPTNEGWRDVLLSVTLKSDTSNHICEVQIMHERMLTFRALPGRAVYEKVRNASELLERAGLAELWKDNEWKIGPVSDDGFFIGWDCIVVSMGRYSVHEEDNSIDGIEKLDDDHALVAANRKYGEIVLDFRGRAIKDSATLLGLVGTLPWAPVSLDLTGCEIGDKGGIAVAELLERMGSLHTLELANNQLGEQSAKAIADALFTNSSLSSLNLFDNAIGIEGARALARALNSNFALRRLFLGNGSVGDEGATAISAALAGPNSSLIELELSNNMISDEGGVAIGAALSINASLRTLNLGGNSIGVEGGKAIGDALTTNAVLRTLYLDSNYLSEEGAIALREALSSTNVTLRTIDLERNSIYDADTMEALRAVMAERGGQCDV